MHPSTAARRLHLGPSHSQGHTLQQARGVHRQPCGLTGMPCLWFTSAVSGAALLSMSFCPLGYLGHIFMVIPEVQEKSKWKQAVLNGKAQNCHAFIANHTLLVKRGYVATPNIGVDRVSGRGQACSRGAKSGTCRFPGGHFTT